MAIGGNLSGGANRSGALSSNSYANVGTDRDARRSSWNAGQAKLASETKTLRAATGEPPYAARGYWEATAEAWAAGTPRTAAIALW